MPKTCTVISEDFAARSIEIFPTVAFFDDGLQILLPDDFVLHGILDDRAREARGQIAGAKIALSVEGGHGKTARYDADGLGRREGAARAFQLGFSVERLALAKLAKHGHHPTNLL